MKRTLINTLILAELLGGMITLTGCAKFMGGTRHEPEDEYLTRSYPTSGGRWAERGMLEEAESESYSGSSSRGDRRTASVYDSSLTDANGERYSTWSNRGEASQSNRSPASVMDAPSQYDDQAPKMEPVASKRYKNGNRATRADFRDESQNEGSLWASDGQTNYYFTKNKIRGVGDIVTVTIENDLVRDINLEIKRSLSPKEKEVEIAKVQQIFKAKALGVKIEENKKELDENAKKEAAKKEEEKIKANNGFDDTEYRIATLNDVDISKELEIKPSDVMLGEILERYPNGNFKIRGTKKVIYKNGAPRLVNVVAIVKNQDISEEDVVNSGKLYEYRLEAIPQ